MISKRRDSAPKLSRITKDGMYRVSYADTTGLSRDEYVARQPQRYEEIFMETPSLKTTGSPTSLLINSSNGVRLVSELGGSSLQLMQRMFATPCEYIHSREHPRTNLTGKRKMC